ncbi:MAG: hypothetical protein EA380_08340 [Phycisphaeraceae bacterium]|nr:MAG: hypothetical protein EA380_08340 [Phycisphaeraceae bacterium]
MPKTIQLPDPRKWCPPWWEWSWIRQLIGGMLVFAGAAFFAVRMLVDSQTPKWIGFSLAIIAGVQLILTIWNTVVERKHERERRRANDPLDLMAQMRAINHQLRQRLGLETKYDSEIRITLYRLEGDPFQQDTDARLRQVTEYVGGPGGSPPRSFTVRSGIIGVAARLGDAFVITRESENGSEFVHEMAKKWGYTIAEAQAIASDRSAWMAVPIFGEEPGRPIGVLYLDSRRPEAFDGASRGDIIHAVGGLEEILRERYRS